jgi:tetratricopeptide (TPR) repeat protein
MLVKDACNVFPKETVDLLASDAVKGADVVEAWFRALGSNWEHSDHGGVFVMSLFRAFFDPSHRLAFETDRLLRLRTSKSGAHFSRQGSWLEATRRLTGALFHLGRMGEPTPQKRKWLSKVLELTDYALSNDPTMRKPANFIRSAGFRGVSCVLLARTADAPVPYYDEAVECLRWTRELGDSSLENGQYLVESYLHLVELKKDHTCLPKAEAVLHEVHRHPKAARRAFTLSGEVHTQKGFASLIAEQPDKAFERFVEAEIHFTTALAMPADPTTDDAYVLRDRGLSRYMLFATANRLGKQPHLDKLDGAIADLGTGEPDGKLVGFGGVALPNVLFIRARLFREAGDLPKTHDFLGRALQAALKTPNADALLHSIRVTQCALELEAQVASGNIANIVEAFRGLLSFRSAGRVPFAPLAHAARAVIRLDPALGANLATQVVDEADSLLATEDLAFGAKQFTASHAGGLALYLAKESNKLNDYLRAYTFYRFALCDRTTAIAPETLGLAGDTALRIAKTYLSGGNDNEAESFFRDAVAHYRDALAAASATTGNKSAAFKERESFSKLGECLLRLNTLNSELPLLNEAIESFEQSKRLGNDSAELAGLLGDAFYRRGRALQNEKDLMRCVTFKEEARQKGNNSRENLSVSARVHFQLAELTGDPYEYRRGLELLVQGFSRDGLWPWPAFQFAEIIERLSKDFRQDFATLLSIESHLKAAFADGESGHFLDEAVNRVLKNLEFDRVHLGGRRGQWDFVYVLDDPHRLLSESYVFKQTTLGNAERDQRTIREFRHFLNNRAKRSTFILPEALRITHVSDDKVVYLMRKSVGTQLGQLIIRRQFDNGDDPKSSFLDALEFLACFHAWSGVQDDQNVQRILKELFRDCLNETEAGRLAREIPDNWAVVRKKDAHPENWLLGTGGKIIMLDFEAAKRCPLLLDVVQLIDDYPLLKPDSSGWGERLQMVARYLRWLKDLGLSLPAFSTEMIGQVFAALATYRCAYGLSQQKQKYEKALARDSMSTLRAIGLRSEHYKKMLGFLSHHAPSAVVREVAKTFLQDTFKTSKPKRRTIAGLDEQAPEAFS